MARAKKVKVRGVFERPKGSDVWWIRFYDAEGKERRETVGSKGDAIALYQKRKSEARAGIKLPEKNKAKATTPTFAEIADHGLAWSKREKRDYVTDIYRVKTLKEEFGDMLADAIRPVDINAYLTDEDREWAKATQNKHLTTMNMIYREAQNSELIPKTLNPCRGVEYRKELPSRIRYLRDHEEESILKQIKYRKYEGYADHYLIAVHTGMRRGEQFGLDWRDVDLDHKIVTLDETKNGDPRIVKLNEVALACFERLWEARQKRKTEKDAVFVSSKYHVRYKDARMWFGAICEDLKLTDVTWHILRHTFISRLVIAGVPMKAVQQFAGHKSIKQTEKYSHLAPELTDEYLERIVNRPKTGAKILRMA